MKVTLFHGTIHYAWFRVPHLEWVLSVRLELSLMVSLSPMMGLHVSEFQLWSQVSQGRLGLKLNTS